MVSRGEPDPDRAAGRARFKRLSAPAAVLIGVVIVAILLMPRACEQVPADGEPVSAVAMAGFASQDAGEPPTLDRRTPRAAPGQETGPRVFQFRGK